MNKNSQLVKTEAVALLQQLIATPSVSKEEWETASLITKFLFGNNCTVTRVGNNVLAKNKHYKEGLPTLLLNSHHDTVPPNKGYTRNPYAPDKVDGKLYGLGSNDAGGALVALMATFLFFEEAELPINLLLAATAEEEISGPGGIELALQHLPLIDCAIVGEPTEMQMAIAERGLLVLDGLAHGKAGHAARNEGVNALYAALKDIEWFGSYEFEKSSELLGPVKMSVTVVETENKAHNIVPSTCRFVVDVRINEQYTHQEILDTIRRHVKSEVHPRSSRLRSTIIQQHHPLVQAGLQLGKACYGSPTSSDKALMPFPALKMGPGNSARSHTADEFIYLSEVEAGIDDYIQLVQLFMQSVKNQQAHFSPQ